MLLAGCDVVPSAQTATRFVARLGCSCVFVSQRELSQCLEDLPAEASWLSVSTDEDAMTVTARALWIEGRAQFSEGRGCMLLD
jgi:hypothetical protein